MSQSTSSKEASLFRQVVRLYEDRQYKRGLKTADQVLKKNPKHADTIAMKGLIYNAQHKSDEAFALSREAIKVDPKSQVAWHVFGMVQRTHRNYDEALKAFKVALKLEPESAQILRDLVILLVYTGDYPGYIQKRKAMLQSHAQVRNNWVALATGYHLDGKLADAEKTLTAYDDTCKSAAPLASEDFEQSEWVLYKNQLIAEQGDYQRALEHLEDKAKGAMDRVSYLESKAKYLVQLERFDEAAKAYRKLLRRNPDNHSYYYGLITAKKLEEGDVEARVALFEHYAQKYPRSDSAKRLPLDFLSGSRFREVAQVYVELLLNRGVTSVFSNVKSLYADEEKKQALLQIVENFVAEKEKAREGESQTEDKKTTQTLATGYLYLAQHYNYHDSRDLERAEEYVNKSLELVPDWVEGLMAQARLCKYRGHYDRAADCLEKARLLDTNDRYLNSKAAKYHLLADRVDKAFEVINVFARPDMAGGTRNYILEMQYVWYLLEEGRAHARRGETALALKWLTAVKYVFDTWDDDQIDFHTFFMRRGTLRSYIELVDWERHFRDNPHFANMAMALVPLYLTLHQQLVARGDGPETTAEKNKVKEDEKRTLAEIDRLAKEEAVRKSKQDPNKANAMGELKQDNDPLGLKLIATKTPLEDAMAVVTPLLRHSPRLLEAQLLGFDVQMALAKPVLALKCLRAMIPLADEGVAHPDVHERVVRFQQAVYGKETNADVLEKLLGLIRLQQAPIEDLKAYNQTYRETHEKSARHVASALIMAYELGEADEAATLAAVSDLVQRETTTYGEAEAILERLRLWQPTTVFEGAKKLVRTRWPAASRYQN